MAKLFPSSDRECELVQGGGYYNPDTGAYGFVSQLYVGPALLAAQQRIEEEWARRQVFERTAVPPVDVAGTY